MFLHGLGVCFAWTVHSVKALLHPDLPLNGAPWSHLSFRTEPSFAPPVIELDMPQEPAPGHILFAQFGSEATQNAVMIMTQSGKLLWQSDPAATQLVSNLTPARLFGKDVLVYWEASSAVATNLPVSSHGCIRILDDSYQSIYNVTLADPTLSTNGQFDSLIDPHEAFVTPSGTLLVLAYDVQPWDLSAVGGPRNGWIHDGVVYEIDIATNDILFRWRASDYIPITNSHAPLPLARDEVGGLSSPPWDYLHLNSATVFEDGIVVSWRHTFDAIYIDRSTGDVRWTLQGDDGGDFAMTPAAAFQWQHDVHIHRSAEGQMLLSMFNNRNNGTLPLNETYGMLLELTDGEADGHAVASTRIYRDVNEAISSVAGGSMQVLDNGNVFVAYGTQPVIKEYYEDGTVAQTFRFGPRGSHVFPGAGAYRARKHEWKGYPATRPKVTGCLRNDGTADVWMSWNGATEMHSWNLYGGGPGGDLELAVVEAPRDGFETKVTVAAGRFIQAEALGGCRGANETRRSSIVAIVDDCASW